MYLCVYLQLRMAKVKQVGLLAAGCQPWNKDVCAASGDRFAYCATLAIYIYQVNYLCSLFVHEDDFTVLKSEFQC